jgi:hypothetical protein
MITTGNKTGNYTTYKRCLQDDWTNTTQVTKEVWEQTDLSDYQFYAGQPIFIKLEGNKPIGDIDWIPSLYGQQISEMAWWNSTPMVSINSPLNTTYVNGTTQTLNITVPSLAGTEDFSNTTSNAQYQAGSNGWNADYGWWGGTSGCSVDANTTTPGKLYASFSSNAGGTQYSLVTNHTFSGDFDFQVDFDSLNFPGTYDDIQLNFFDNYFSPTQLIQAKRKSTNEYGFYVSGSFTTVGAGGDTSGKLRIKRAGSTCYGYYWSGGAWQLIDSKGCGTYSGYVFIGVQANNVAVASANFDNFIANGNSVALTQFNYNGTNYTYTTPASVDFGVGTHTLNAYANDTWGNKGSSQVNFTIATPHYLTITPSNPADNLTDYDTQSETFQYTPISSTDATGINCDLWLDGAVNTSASVNNNTLASTTVYGMNFTNHTWYINCTDSATTNVSKTRTFALVNTTPVITITSPTNSTYNTAIVLMNFTGITNGTFDSMFGYFPEIPLSTFICSGIGTNTSTCLVNKTFTDGQHNLRITATSAQGKQTNARVYFFVDATPPVSALGTPNGAMPASTTSANFICNQTDNIALANATLWFDFGGTWTANETANISGISNSTTFSKTFNLTNPITWNCNVCDWLGNCAFAPANYSIYALPFNITTGACPVGLVAAQNYTFVDEGSLAGLSNANIATNFRYGSLANNSIDVYNISLSGISSFSICVDPLLTPYYVGYAEIQYSIPGYASRHSYLFVNSTLTNVTQNITLYALQSNPYQSTSQSNSYYNTTTNITTTNTSQLQTTGDYATAFQFTFTDSALNAYTGDYARLLRWYPASGQYSAVDAGISDGNGQTVMYVAQNSVDYRVALYYPNGTLLKLADPSRFTCSGTPCTYTLRISSIGNYLSDFGVQHSLTFTNATKMFSFTWNDPTGATTNMSLVVQRLDGDADYEVCNSYMASPTGALSCNISGYSSGTFSAVAYRSASPQSPLDALMTTLNNTIMSGQMGLFVSFLLMIVMVFVGIYSPVAAILLAVLSMIPALAFGAITPAIFIGIGALGAMVIHVFKRVS